MTRSAAVPLALLLLIAVLALVPAPPVPAGGTLNVGDVAWMLSATGLVLLMTPGLSFFYGGMVSARNVVSTMLQSFIAMGVVSVLWVVVGFSLAFGDSLHGLIGNPLTFFMFHHVGAAPDPRFAATIPLLLFALFQLKFAIITPALITGAFAERIRFSSYLLFICLFSLFIYAPLAHWTWHPDGFLHRMGVLDFAGGTVVHMSAGCAAFVGALMLGRRRSHERSESHEPANVPFVILGTGLLWFGWFGFNAGSAFAASATAVLAFATTNTAAASAMLTWLALDVARGRKPSAIAACVGAVVGLVAITPAAGYVTIQSSLVIGLLASAASYAAVHWKTRSVLDDTLDVFPCHGVGGMVGMVATGIFATQGGLITGQWALFLHHLLALVIVVAFTMGGSYILYRVTDAILPLRVDEEAEDVGLDLAQHGEAAMPSLLPADA
ncbi:MAG TPA: ammonium transporter [Vicinamibacterales bacterium]